MLFDVVLGNPPYNSDAYIGFVTKGYTLIKDDGVAEFITPAKWINQLYKRDRLFEEVMAFRREIVPHMKDIVFFNNETEVFDIMVGGGVAYYTIDKSEHAVKHIRNENGDIAELRSDCNRELNGNLWNCAESIIRKIVDEKFCFESKKIPEGDADGLYVILHETMSGSSTPYDNYGKVYICCPPRLWNGKHTGDLDKMTFIVKECNSIEECKSLSSFINTRLIRFLLLTSIVSRNVCEYETWRYIPSPGTLDHIFTDTEMYQKYGLTLEEVKTIESVVKERKWDEVRLNYNESAL